MPVPILDPTRNWECPSCGFQHVSKDPKPHSPLHACPKQAGLSVPLVEVTDNHGLRRGTVRHVAVERQDYIGRERGVHHDRTGRAVMAIRTERGDGSNDVRILAPTATNRRPQ